MISNIFEKSSKKFELCPAGVTFILCVPGRLVGTRFVVTDNAGRIVLTHDKQYLSILF
tara:strand:- start:358 stop:531 length:174 start_codon:yes stop_codon:yes gene_type:complete